MKLEVGKTYIRNDFRYSALIVSIRFTVVHYEFCNLKDGYKHRWDTDVDHFKKNYTLASDLLTALL